MIRLFIGSRLTTKLSGPGRRIDDDTRKHAAAPGVR
jgi:hypothetical protein